MFYFGIQNLVLILVVPVRRDAWIESVSASIVLKELPSIVDIPPQRWCKLVGEEGKRKKR